MDYDEMQSLLGNILNDEEESCEPESLAANAAQNDTGTSWEDSQTPAAGDDNVEAKDGSTTTDGTDTPVPDAPATPQPIAEEDGDFDFDGLLSTLDEEEAPMPDVPAGPEPDMVEEVAEDDSPEEDDAPLSLADLLGDEEDAPAATQEIIFADVEKPKGETVPMPTFTSGDIAEALDIRNYASLVTLNTRRWSGKVKDRQASKLAADSAGADAAAFETHKRLLSGADEKLRTVTKTIDDARTKSYAMTLPWSTMGRTDTGKRTGGRLLPHTCFQEYITEMSKAQHTMKAALDEFVAGYQDAINLAQKNLGTRFDPSEYPNPATIRDRFGLDFDFHPIPIGDDFKGLADQQVAHLANTLEKKNRTMLENAMQETWARAYDLVERAAESFSEPKKLFHYTLIDSLRDAGNSLKYLNVTGDTMIEKVRTVIAKNLTAYDADDIRKDEALRKRLGQIATALLREMKEHAA